MVAKSHCQALSIVGMTSLTNSLNSFPTKEGADQMKDLYSLPFRKKKVAVLKNSEAVQLCLDFFYDSHIR